MNSRKVALVHDWLIHMRGGERVLEALAEMFPDATIYTLFYHREFLSPSLRSRKMKASFLHYVPGIRRFYRLCLPLFPYGIKTLHLESDTTLVISSSHCVAKGISVPKNATHICYCHTPMRYAWGFQDSYFERIPQVLRPLLHGILARLRKWDQKINSGVNHFVANSENVKRRVEKFYSRDAEVVHPPLDAQFFYSPNGTVGDYYLVVSAFVPYKRVDLAIEAFNSLDRPLKIVGSGPLEKRYRNLRQTNRISFLGAVSNEELKELYSGARALIFPTEEDLGIIPMEAQACGTPVIAFAKGGALETVKHGIFFGEQTPQAIQAAVRQFENMEFDRSAIAKSVASFDKTFFKEKMLAVIDRAFKNQNVYVNR